MEAKTQHLTIKHAKAIISENYHILIASLTKKQVQKRNLLINGYLKKYEENDSIEALINNKSVNMGDKWLQDNEAYKIAYWIYYHNKDVQELYLWENKINNPGCIAIAESLKWNTTLLGINLRQNQIGDEGAIAIAHALKMN